MTLLLSKEQIEAIQARADDAHTYWFKVTEFHKHARTDIPALCQQALRAIELEAAMEEMRGQRHKLGARIVGLQTELTAIEADRDNAEREADDQRCRATSYENKNTTLQSEIDRMREALEWIRDELPDRDDWDNFEEHSALVLRMRAKARAALTPTNPDREG